MNWSALRLFAVFLSKVVILNKKNVQLMAGAGDNESDSLISPTEASSGDRVLC